MKLGAETMTDYIKKFEVGQPFNPYNMFHGIFIPTGLVEHSQVKDSVKILMGRLFMYAGRDGKAYPYRENLAKECGWEIRKLDRVIKETKKIGLIKTRPHITKNTENEHTAPSEYIFLYSSIYDEGNEAKIPTDKNDSRPTDKNDNGGTVKNDEHKKTHIKKNHNFSYEKCSQDEQRRKGQASEQSCNYDSDETLEEEQDKILEHWEWCDGKLHKSESAKGMIAIKDMIEELLIDGRNPYGSVEDDYDYLTRKWSSDEIISCIDHYTQVLKKDISKWYFDQFVIFINRGPQVSLKNYSPLVMCHKQLPTTSRTEFSDDLKKRLIEKFHDRKFSTINSDDDLVYDNKVIPEKTIIQAAKYLEEIDKKYTFHSKRHIGYIFYDYLKEKLNNLDWKLNYIAGDGFGQEFEEVIVKRNMVMKKVSRSGGDTLKERERQRAELMKIKGMMSEERYKRELRKIGRLFVKDGKITYK